MKAILLDEAKKWLEENCENQYTRMAVFGIIQSMPTVDYQKTPNEWVSVEERLPEPGERVLATDCGFVGEFYINKRGKWQRYNVNCFELLMALDILYWMPLPERPKEDQQ